MWDAVKMETLAILKGQHERGVCAVDFSGKTIVIVQFFLLLSDLVGSYCYCSVGCVIGEQMPICWQDPCKSWQIFFTGELLGKTPTITVSEECTYVAREIGSSKPLFN